jgi:hypothetical protein
MSYTDYEQVIVAKIELVSDLLDEIEFPPSSVDQAIDLRLAAFDRAYRAVSQTIDDVEGFADDEDEDDEDEG